MNIFTPIQPTYSAQESYTETLQHTVEALENHLEDLSTQLYWSLLFNVILCLIIFNVILILGIFHA